MKCGFSKSCGVRDRLIEANYNAVGQNMSRFKD